MPARTPATTKEPPPRSGEAPVPVSGLSLEHVENWIFDLDNTLYPADSNLFAVIDQRMKAFISAELGIEADDAFRVQKDYFRKYGTTLRGLMLHHGTNPHAFLDYVHDI
ncbi:MAG: hypothetical protein QF833_02990, partial [Alphaproteobacteria bacterium]|nr:hypothetical protein [Alphaproteobacteria bacterium]